MTTERNEMSAPDVTVPVFASRFVSRTRPTGYMTLANALNIEHASDACCAAYSMPEIPRRLVNDELDVYGGVRMALFVVDVDDEEAHRSGRESSHAWWSAERTKIDRLFADRPAGFAYRTRAGYRLVYRLARTFVIRNADDARTWRASYLGGLDHLSEQHGIEADRSCSDWTRLHRLPRATRDGRPERRETIGNARAVGLWNLTIVDPGSAPRRGAPTGDAESSILGRAHVERGLAGRTVRGRLHVRCIWRDQHTTGRDYDGSTVVMPPTTERRVGWWHCSHAHCASRTQAEVRLALGVVLESSRLTRLRAMLAEDQGDGQRCSLEDVEDCIGIAIGLAEAAPHAVVVVDVTLGAGKTRGALRAMAASGGRYVYAVPTHALADEVEARLADLATEVDRRRGLLRVIGPDGASACRQHRRAAPLQRVGGRIHRLLCPNCEHRSGCPARQRHARERVTVAPHQLAQVALERDDDEPNKPRPLLILDETPALLEELTLTRSDLDEAVRLLSTDVLDARLAEEIAAWTRALRAALDDPTRALAPPETFIGRGAVEPRGDLLAMSPEDYDEAIRALRIFRGIVAAQEVERIAWRTDGLAVHVETPEAWLIRASGCVLLDATPPLDALQKICQGSDATVATITLNVRDGAEITRTVLYSTRASRTKLAPRRKPDWAAVKPLLARGLEQVTGRILLVTHAPIADGIRRGALADIVSGHVDVGRDVAHFGAVRGIDRWRECDAIITLGDPWPELGSAREQARVLSLDPEAHLTWAARAELAQAHGRLRDPSRTRPATHVHIGTLAPLGWTSENTTIVARGAGRPRRTSTTTLTPDQLRCWVRAQGGLRAAARSLQIGHQTLARYVRGERAMPDGIAGKITHSVFGTTCTCRGGPENTVKRSTSIFGTTQGRVRPRPRRASAVLRRAA